MATSLIQREKVPEHLDLSSKDYVLNKQKSLKKKLIATENDHIRYNLTGGGLRLFFSTSSYELFRLALGTFYENKKKENESNILHKKVFDKSGATNVEDQYKVKCDGFDSRGRNTKLSCFSINLYHTTSSLLVNGKKLHIFMEDLPKIVKSMETYQVDGNPVDLTKMNKCFREIISKSLLEDNSDNAKSTNDKELQTVSGNTTQTNNSATPSSVTCVTSEDQNTSGIEFQDSSGERSIHTLLNQLIMKTDNVLKIVKSIEERQKEDKVDCDNKISQLNDRLTSITKQVAVNDQQQTDNLHGIEMQVNVIKADQNKNFISVNNKIQSVVDKVKDISRLQHKPSQDKVLLSDKNSASNSSKIADVSSQQRPQADRDLPKERTIPKQLHGNKTLIIGSSIIKGIDKRRISKHVDVQTHRGATVPTLTEKLRSPDLENYSTIVVVVGGNDASSNVSLERFRSNFSIMLQNIHIFSSDAKIVVSEICPRNGVNVRPYNAMIQEVCSKYQDIKVVKQEDSFLSRSGDMISLFYHRDQIHLTNHGTVQLLRNINNVISIFDAHTSVSYAPGRSINTQSKYFNGHCYACGMYGHHFKQCYMHSE